MNWYKIAKLEDIPDNIQKMFGMGKYQPKTKYHKCPKCGQNKAYIREMHPNTDINEMALYCSDCGEIQEKTQSIKCPFCNEDGYDLAGLKSHLEHGDCDKFNSVENITRVF